MEEIRVVRGPTQDLGVASPLIYNVTLASGMVVTNPGGFGSEGKDVPASSQRVIVAENGRVLTPTD